MEDLDTPRVVPGADRAILDALQRYALEWDGEVVYQSTRIDAYETALSSLREKNLVFDCACSRAELQSAASAPLGREPIYPGTCRNGTTRPARSVRFRANGVIVFDDVVFGHIEEVLATTTGDFVVKRADGVFAYQLAVVVDDEWQGVTQVVRGADLLASTPRQIALQRALGYRTPQYAHLPLVVDATGAKIGKRQGLYALDDDALQVALRVLGIDVERDAPAKMLENALARFSASRVPRRAWTPSA